MSNRYSSVTGSKPNFDVAMAFNGPDESEMTYTNRGVFTDPNPAKGTTRNWSGLVAGGGKQPGHTHSANVILNTSGLAIVTQRSIFVPIITDAATSYDNPGRSLSVEIKYVIDTAHDTALTVWERLALANVQLISGYTSNVPNAASLDRIVAQMAGIPHGRG
jgi:hypothetical protein